jgi:hypothetical protein
MCVYLAGKTVGGVASSAGTNRAHFAVKDSPEAAFVHPSSVNAERFRNASEKGQKPVWILYHTKVKTKQVVTQVLHATLTADTIAVTVYGSAIVLATAE